MTVGGRLQARPATLPDVLLGKTYHDVPCNLLLPRCSPESMALWASRLPRHIPLIFDFSSKTLSWNRWSDPEAIGIRDKCVNVALRITYSSWTASPPG